MPRVSSINLVDYYVGYRGNTTFKSKILSWSGGLSIIDDFDQETKIQLLDVISSILTNFPIPSSLYDVTVNYMNRDFHVDCSNRLYDYSEFPVNPLGFRVNAQCSFHNLFSLNTNIGNRELVNWLESDAAKYFGFSLFALFSIDSTYSYRLSRYEYDDSVDHYLNGDPGYYLSNNLDELEFIANRITQQ